MKKILYIIMLSTFCFGKSFTTYDVYELSCGKFIENITVYEDMNGYYKDYIAGFITGTNYLKTRNTQGKDISGMFLWLKNYCNANPLEAFIKALIELDKTLDTQ